MNDPNLSNYLQSSLRLALSTFSIFISIETGLRIPLLHPQQTSVKSHGSGFVFQKLVEDAFFHKMFSIWSL